jgi:hypothetical protein
LSFTPLQPKLGIAHGDFRLVFGCSAMETHFRKLPTNSYCADVASSGSWISRVGVAYEDILFFLHTSALGSPVLWACVAYHFVAELLLLLDVFTSQYQHLVDRGSSSRAEIWQTNLLKRWYTMSRWTSLSSSVRPLYCQCLSMLHTCQQCVAEIAKSTNLKVSTYFIIDVVIDKLTYGH